MRKMKLSDVVYRDETKTEYPISVVHNYVTLSGVILPTNHYLTVRLDKPSRYAGIINSGVNCFAAAVAWNGFERKRLLFDYLVTYSDRAIERAKGMLVRHYEEQLEKGE